MIGCKEYSCEEVAKALKVLVEWGKAQVEVKPEAPKPDSGGKSH